MIRDRSSRLQQEDVCTLPETEYQDFLARSGCLKHVREHHQGVGGARIPDHTREIIAHRLGSDARLFGERSSGAPRRNAGNEMHDLGGRYAMRCKGTGNRSTAKLGMALLTNPARFPTIIIDLAGSAKMVDKVGSHAVEADETGDTIVGADKQTGGSIAVHKLVFGGRACPALLGGNREDRAGASDGSIECLAQHARTGTLATRDIERRYRVVEHQCFLDDARVLTVGIGMRGRRQHDPPHRVARPATKTIARGLDGHGDAVLIPVGDRALAFGERLEPRREPAIGGERRSPLQPHARDIGAI